MKISLLTVLALILLSSPLYSFSSHQNQLTVTAVNRLKVPRQNETVELTGRDLASLGEKDLMKIHVRDSSGKGLVCQSVDTDYDEYHKPDIVIFQTDFAPNETKTFVVSAGNKREYKKERLSRLRPLCARAF